MAVAMTTRCKQAVDSRTWVVDAGADALAVLPCRVRRVARRCSAAIDANCMTILELSSIT